MKHIVQQRFEQSRDAVRQSGEQLGDRIVDAAELIIASCRDGGCLFTFGNGGSACDAQHIACELVGRFLAERPAIRAEALTTDTASISSIANDYGFEAVFARQLEGKARAGDVALAISTSGNSPNVVAALTLARRIGMRTVALTGAGGGKCAALADVLLEVPNDQTPRIQEAHAVIYHILCELIEDAFAEQGE